MEKFMITLTAEELASLASAAQTVLRIAQRNSRDGTAYEHLRGALSTLCAQTGLEIDRSLLT